MTLRYSDAAQATRARFYAPYNDVTIVVEDISLENFYTQLMQRLFEDTLRIRKVVGVGGKAQVLNRMEKNETDNGHGNEYYLIDGDFDALIGITMPVHERLYQLEYYDIESVLIEPDGICTIAEEELPSITAADYRKRLRFRSWFADVVNVLTPLIACYALVVKFESDEPRINQGIFRFLEEDACTPRRGAIEKYVAEVSAKLSPNMSEDFDSQMRRIQRQMGRSAKQKSRWVSGKNILLPLVAGILRQFTSHNISHDSLRFRLARQCGLLKLEDFKIAVLEFSEAQADNQKI